MNSQNSNPNDFAASCRETREIKHCSDCLRFRSCLKNGKIDDEGNSIDWKGGETMPERNQSVKDYLDSIYWPKTKMGEIGTLLIYLGKVRLRPIEYRDRYRTRLTCLVINIKGNGERAAFDSWEIKYVDINHVSKEYAEVYVYSDEARGLPSKIKIDNKRLSIIDRVY